MKKQKSLGNKGFSLVELIIVIAIMAILVGVLAPQLIKYVERSRQAKDRQMVDALHTAVTTALLDPDITDGPGATSSSDMADFIGTGSKFKDAISDILKTSTPGDIGGNSFESNAFHGQGITVTIDPKMNVKCAVTHVSGSDATDIVIE
ncbi:MAG: type II secretion system GspH family protein [Lachnospiraceae bacterium]|nr:type II secretion system GspH family protein [Lachnospiraceae bacterium]